MFSFYFISLFVAHFVFDILFQSEWMAINKTKNNLPLFIHSFIYAFGITLWMILFCCIYNYNLIIIIFSTLFLTHIILDNYQIYPLWRKYIVFSNPENTPKWLYIWIDQTFHLVIIYLLTFLLI